MATTTSPRCRDSPNPPEPARCSRSAEPPGRSTRWPADSPGPSISRLPLTGRSTSPNCSPSRSARSTRVRTRHPVRCSSPARPPLKSDPAGPCSPPRVGSARRTRRQQNPRRARTGGQGTHQRERPGERLVSLPWPAGGSRVETACPPRHVRSRGGREAGTLQGPAQNGGGPCLRRTRRQVRPTRAPPARSGC